MPCVCISFQPELPQCRWVDGATRNRRELRNNPVLNDQVRAFDCTAAEEAENTTDMPLEFG